MPIISSSCEKLLDVAHFRDRVKPLTSLSISSVLMILIQDRRIFLSPIRPFWRDNGVDQFSALLQQPKRLPLRVIEVMQ